jgi:O-antigen/teichoic acid export membrane protein
MALPILAAPVLGRLYIPAEYGALAQYMAVAALLSVVATLQYQHAIIAERTHQSAVQAVWLCIAASLGIGIVAGIGVALCCLFPLCPQVWSLVAASSQIDKAIIAL